jgi:hypothetical protein
MKHTVLAIIFIPLLVVMIGLGIPYLTIGDGLANYQEEELTFATHAKAQAKQKNRLDLVAQVVRVDRLDFEACEAIPGLQVRYLSIVELYTLFGIPLGQYQVTCTDITKVN